MRQKTFFFVELSWSNLACHCWKVRHIEFLCLMLFFCCFWCFLFNVFPKDPLICPKKGVYIVYHAFSPLVQGWKIPTPPWGRDFTLCWLVELRKAFDDSDFNKDGYLDKEERSERWSHRSCCTSWNVPWKTLHVVRVVPTVILWGLYPSCCINFNLMILSKVKWSPMFRILGIKRSLDRFTQTELDSHSLSV